MYKILLFGGTSEGRRLTEYLLTRQVSLHVSVAGAYGRDLLPKDPGLTVHTGRLSREEMADLIRLEAFDLVIDATHPYAAEASDNTCAACRETGTKYLRLTRPAAASPENEDLLTAADPAEAVRLLSETEGPVFLTTGSKNLKEFMAIPASSERLFIRILPDRGGLEAALETGLAPSHIMCMQGPFDNDMNRAAIRHFKRQWEKEQGHASPMWMVTKQSGSAGGFEAKLEAALAEDCRLLVIGRPAEKEGLTLEETMAHLAALCPVREDMPRQVCLIGCGMSKDQLTLEADRIIRDADLLIGASRMLEMVKNLEKPVFCAYDSVKIRDYIRDHTVYRRIAVLFSGDIGFYSGAARLRDLLKDEPVTVTAVSGIATPVHFLGQIGRSWENVYLVSLHGQRANMAAIVARHPRVLALLGRPEDVPEISRKLQDCALGHVRMWIGSCLKMADEQIVSGRPEDFKDTAFPALSVLYIENPQAEGRPVTFGLPDEAFIRGQVPMTKSEVRSLILSRLALPEDAVLYDIGTGTGSVAVEAARLLPKGRVYAVDCVPESMDLLAANAARHHCDQIIPVFGTAPQALRDLEAPTHAFIGGSRGHLDEILTMLIDKNSHVRIVMTAVTLETVSALLAAVRKLRLPDPEIIQVQVSRARKAGPSHLMTAANPVYIITLPAADQSAFEGFSERT